MILINQIADPGRAGKEFFAKPAGLKFIRRYMPKKVLDIIYSAYPKRLRQWHDDSWQNRLSNRMAALSIDNKDITIFDNFLLSLEHRVVITILNSKCVNLLVYNKL